MTRMAIFMLIAAVGVIAVALYQVTLENYGFAGVLAGLGMALAGMPALFEALTQQEEHDDAG